MGLRDTTELAKARNRAATERTLLSWLQVCLILIGAGVACNRIAVALQANPVALVRLAPTSLRWIQGLGLGAVGLGLGLLSLSILVYIRTARALNRRSYGRLPLRQLDLQIMVAAVVLTGAVIFVAVVLAVL
ncbi:MAG: DUF202 domain-containing protein [Elainella sp.]